MNNFFKKILYSNLIQNLAIVIVSIIYFNSYQIKGGAQVFYLIIIYLIYFSFTLIEFYYYENIQVLNAIKVYNLLSFILVLIYLLGGIDLLREDISIFSSILLILINFSRYIILILYSKKYGCNYIDSYEDFNKESVKINIHETIVLIISFLFLTINPSTKISFIFSAIVTNIYLVIYHKRINNFKFISVLIQMLMILCHFGIRGIINYSIYGLVFMLLFRNK